MTDITVGPAKYIASNRQLNARNATGRGRSRPRNANRVKEKVAKNAVNAMLHTRMSKGNVGSAKTEFKWQTKLVQNAMVDI